MFFVVGYISFVIAAFGMLLSAQPKFTYFLFLELASLIIILLGHFFRHKRIQKSKTQQQNSLQNLQTS
jgi:hypothetical protein